MGANSKIEWTDHTWNPWIGCTKVSPACDHCYAEALMDHRQGRVRWGTGEDRSKTAESTWNDPIRWDRAATKAGRKDTVFCLSLGDIWDNEVDPLWRAQAFRVMERTPSLIYLLLSKRIGNAVKMCDPMAGHDCLPRNAAIGATMVNQAEWDRDIQKLTNAAERLGALFTFASVEPMLGPINARDVLPDWVICGGESGPNARPMHPAWARSLRDRCAAAGVPFFFKQWGEWLPVYDDEDEDGRQCWQADDGRVTGDLEGVRVPLIRNANGYWARTGKSRAGRLLDGREHSAFPESRR